MICIAHGKISGSHEVVFGAFNRTFKADFQLSFDGGLPLKSGEDVELLLNPADGTVCLKGYPNYHPVVTLTDCSGRVTIETAKATDSTTLKVDEYDVVLHLPECGFEHGQKVDVIRYASGGEIYWLYRVWEARELPKKASGPYNRVVENVRGIFVSRQGQTGFDLTVGDVDFFVKCNASIPIGSDATIQVYDRGELLLSGHDSNRYTVNANALYDCSPLHSSTHVFRVRATVQPDYSLLHAGGLKFELKSDPSVSTGKHRRNYSTIPVGTCVTLLYYSGLGTWVADGIFPCYVTLTEPKQELSTEFNRYNGTYAVSVDGSEVVFSAGRDGPIFKADFGDDLINEDGFGIVENGYIWLPETEQVKEIFLWNLPNMSDDLDALLESLWFHTTHRSDKAPELLKLYMQKLGTKFGPTVPQINPEFKCSDVISRHLTQGPPNGVYPVTEKAGTLMARIEGLTYVWKDKLIDEDQKLVLIVSGRQFYDVMYNPAKVVLNLNIV